MRFFVSAEGLRARDLALDPPTGTQVIDYHSNHPGSSRGGLISRPVWT